MRTYTAAIVQMNSTPDLSENLKQAEVLVKKAVDERARLVVLPECFAYLGPEKEMLAQAEEIAAEGERFLKENARKHEIYLCGGVYTLPENFTRMRNRRVYNTAMLCGPNGDILKKYEKMHLFDVDIPDGVSYRESDYVRGGDGPILFSDEELGKIGMSVCYDVRFPELYRHLSSRGAEVFVIPSAFTAFTGKDHWEVLVRARAIENLAYVIAPTQVGTHFGKRQSYGHGMIVDPWGAVIAAAGVSPGVSVAEINPDGIATARTRIPALTNRKLKN